MQIDSKQHTQQLKPTGVPGQALTQHGQAREEEVASPAGP